MGATNAIDGYKVYFKKSPLCPASRAGKKDPRTDETIET